MKNQNAIKRPLKSVENRLVISVTVGSSAFLFFRGQLAWLKEQGWEVTLLTSPDDEAIKTAEREKVEFKGVEMQRSIRPIKDLKSLAQWIISIQHLKPTVVSAGTPKAGLLGMLAAFICRVPRRLYVVRGLRLEGASGLIAKFLWCLEWLTVKCATDVVYVSESLALECNNRGLFVKKKSWLIGRGSSNGVDALAVHAAKQIGEIANLRSEIGYVDEDFVVGFIGRINRDKGVDQLIRASNDPNLHPRIKFLLIGTIEEPSLLEDSVVDMQRVKAIGRKDDVWKYFSTMSVFCLPTKREGFPNVVLEASAAKVPTLTTTATGAVDSVINGETGLLFNFGDIDAIVNGLNRLASSPETARKMGEAAFKRVQEEFSPESVWAGYQEIMLDTQTKEFAKRINIED